MKIFFIGATPQARVYKQVKALQIKYSQIEISLVCYRYDKVLFKDIFKDVFILKSSNPNDELPYILENYDIDTIHIFTDKLAIVKPVIKSKIPYVFDPYDYFLEQDKLSQKVLFEHWQEMISNASAILLRYDISILDSDEFKSLNIKDKRVIQMFDYALPEFFVPKIDTSKRNNRIAHIGYVSSLSLPRNKFGATQFDNVAMTIIKKRPYDIFCSLWSDDFEKISKEYNNTIKSDSGSFNIYSALDQFSLNDTISKYKYGSYIHDCTEATKNKTPYINNSIGNKIFNYLEAGLPIIATDNFKATSNFIEEFGIGVNIGKLGMFNSSIDNIDINYEDLLQRCYLARENELNINNHIYKLMKLHKQIQ